MAASATSQDQRVYRITLQGRMDEEFVSAYCPAGTVLVQEGDIARLTNVRADQAAIIGLVRHLYHLGFTILALETVF